MFWVRIRLGGREYLGVLDTGATMSIVATKILPCGDLKKILPTTAICMGDGHVVHSCGDSHWGPNSSSSTPRFYPSPCKHPTSSKWTMVTDGNLYLWSSLSIRLAT